MGKSSKSITALSAKQKLKAVKSASLQKVSKKGIVKSTKDPIRQNDLDQLKQLLRLESDAKVNPRLLDEGHNNIGGMDLDDGMGVSKSLKPSQKQRRRNQLIRLKSQRDKTPLLIADRQVKSAEEKLESQMKLSRG